MVSNPIKPKPDPNETKRLQTNCCSLAGRVFNVAMAEVLTECLLIVVSFCPVFVVIHEKTLNSVGDLSASNVQTIAGLKS